MNGALRLVYESVARVARAITDVTPASAHGKLATTFAIRRGALARFRAFRRDTSRHLVWMHAPSVGEGLQARPILELLRHMPQAPQLGYTYFSPSARGFASTLDVDFRDVLPFDVASDMREIVHALAPTALVFSKLDVWPMLAREASYAGARLGLVSATLAENSSRRGRLAVALLRDTYARLDKVGAISADDADRLVAMGVPSERVSVTGDARYDQVWARAASVQRDGRWVESLRSDRFTVVAGSTWPADENHLLRAWTRVVQRQPAARLIIAPHEPTPEHLTSIEQWAMSTGLRFARLDAVSQRDADVVLVDRVGVLGELYVVGDAAFVGGAFHVAGLHSVLEPAAFGLPVLFGPQHRASRDARLLLDADAAVSSQNYEQLARTLERWMAQPDDRRAAGAAARDVVHAGLGAAQRSFALVTELLR